MSEGYTETRLTAGQPDEGSPEVHIWAGPDENYFGSVSSEDFDEATRDANARRLVACWNAAEGLTTEALERMEPGAVKGLLEACHGGPGFSAGALPDDLDEIAGAFNLFPDEISGFGSSTRAAAERLRAYANALRLALAKATGQPGGEV